MRASLIPAAMAITAAAALLPGCCGHSSSRSDAFDAFKLRPQVEDAYGYTHAIRVGDRIMISGAVSMDDEGKPTAVGDLSQQMRNCYADLDKVLKHYGCTFEDVVVENIFTTDMAGFLELAAYRGEIYGTRFPTGTWLEVKGLALPEFMIEIELEAHRRQR
jgi:2-iminobutanoate/2-iminopropanoate deaminase